MFIDQFTFMGINAPAISVSVDAVGTVIGRNGVASTDSVGTIVRIDQLVTGVGANSVIYGFRQLYPGVQVHGDADGAIVPYTSNPTHLWNVPLTAPRFIDVDVTGAFDGCKFRIVRSASATGGSALNVGSGPLKALTPGTWCEVEWNGTAGAYFLSAYGAL